MNLIIITFMISLIKFNLGTLSYKYKYTNNQYDKDVIYYNINSSSTYKIPKNDYLYGIYTFT